MKKIAVLTDFSERSANAAIYALMLARHLHADILLFHAFYVPSSEPMSAQIAWPMEDHDEIRSGCEEVLQKLAARLNNKLDEAPTGFRPGITCRAQENVFSTGIDQFINDRDVVLLVMGNHQKGFASLLMGNHTRDVLDNASLPVLVVPESTQFANLMKIALATDLNADDINVIQSLANLARPFNADILLSHLCLNTPENERTVQNFLHEVTNKINYPNIYYRQFEGANQKEGLLQMANAVKADIMVMVHRRKNFFERLFGTSNSQVIAAEGTLPLLVFPHPAHTLPVF